MHNVTMIVSIQWRECITFRCPFLFLFWCICSSAVPLADMCVCVCVCVSQFWEQVDFTEMIEIEMKMETGIETWKEWQVTKVTCVFNKPQQRASSIVIVVKDYFLLLSMLQQRLKFFFLHNNPIQWIETSKRRWHLSSVLSSFCQLIKENVQRRNENQSPM